MAHRNELHCHESLRFMAMSCIRVCCLRTNYKTIGRFDDPASQRMSGWMRSLYLSLLYGMCGATWKILLLLYDVVMSVCFLLT